MNISKNLIGALAALSIGCAGTQANRNEAGLTREHYSLNYDNTPEELAVQLYALDHNGQMPVNRVQLGSYMWSPKDLNFNGVLDFNSDITITRRNNLVLDIYEKVTTRREASNTGREEFSEHHLVRNSNGTYSEYVRNTAIRINPQNLELAIQNYSNGVFAHFLENTGRLLERLQNPNRTEGRRPSNIRQLLHNY